MKVSELRLKLNELAKTHPELSNMDIEVEANEHDYAPSEVDIRECDDDTFVVYLS